LERDGERRPLRDEEAERDPEHEARQLALELVDAAHVDGERELTRRGAHQHARLHRRAPRRDRRHMDRREFVGKTVARVARAPLDLETLRRQHARREVERARRIAAKDDRRVVLHRRLRALAVAQLLSCTYLIRCGWSASVPSSSWRFSMYAW